MERCFRAGRFNSASASSTAATVSTGRRDIRRFFAGILQRSLGIGQIDRNRRQFVAGLQTRGQNGGAAIDRTDNCRRRRVGVKMNAVQNEFAGAGLFQIRGRGGVRFRAGVAGKRDGPGQIALSAVTTAVQKTADAAQRQADEQTGRDDVAQFNTGSLFRTKTQSSQRRPQPTRRKPPGRLRCS